MHHLIAIKDSSVALRGYAAPSNFMFADVEPNRDSLCNVRILLLSIRLRNLGLGHTCGPALLESLTYQAYMIYDIATPTTRLQTLLPPLDLAATSRPCCRLQTLPPPLDLATASRGAGQEQELDAGQEPDAAGRSQILRAGARARCRAGARRHRQELGTAGRN